MNTFQNLEPRCKLCLLLKDSEDLWVEVHNKVIKEKLAHNLVRQWLNGRIDVLNADPKREVPLKPFNAANFSVHFREHVKDVGDMVAQLNEALTQNTATFTAAQQTKAVVVQNWGSDGEYARMAQMLHAVEDDMMAYDKAVEKKRNIGTEPTPREIKAHVDMVTSYFEAKQALVSLKKAEKSMSLALEEAVGEILRGLADKSAAIVEDVKDFLAADLPPDSTLPEDVVKMLKSRLSSELDELGSTILAKVKKEYGIK